MKNFQQNLLIVLALALCGLCIFQWSVQTSQRKEIGTLNGIVYDRNVAFQGATNSIATLNHQVEQLDESMTQLRAEAVTNRQVVATQKARIMELEFSQATLTNEVVQYKTAVDALESKLKDAYAGIAEQNTSISNLVSQRDEMVKKFNDEVKDRNEVVAKYNDLVNQMQKQQTNGSK